MRVLACALAKTKKVEKCSISRKVSKICCIFAPDFETYKQYMNTVGVIGTGAAFVNYRDKKAAYDALVEQHDVLNSVYASYNEKALFEKYAAEYDQMMAEELERLELMNELEAIERQQIQNVRPDGLKVTTLLRVANLVGNKYFKASNTVYFTNCGDKDVYIRDVEFQCSIIDPETNKAYPIVLVDKKGKEINNIGVERWIRMGKTYSFSSGTCFSGGVDAILRNIVKNACHAKSILSCPKVNINGVETAGYIVKWGERTYIDPNARETTFFTNDQPGVLRYVGETGI